jgi:transcriptional regulator with XRE-family HTH domain
MPTGRPVFQIDPTRLRGLRDEAGLTQAEVASRAYQLLKKPDTSATKHYQKVEKTGKTSKAMAQALADVLNTPLGVLIGDSPEDAASGIDRLEIQLLAQLSAGGNKTLRTALEQWTDPSDSNPVRSLAVELLSRIEAAQIGQQPEEMQLLAALTGWSHAQLMRSASVQGHWLLLSTMYGARRSEIVLGASRLRSQIQENTETFAKTGESDSVITLRKAVPWMHVELTSVRHNRMRYAFSFVRCLPLVSGLEWVEPSWRDEFWLVEPLRDWAFSSSNFVVGFDGRSWPQDVRKLRLLLQEFDDGEFTSVMLIKGDLDDLDETALRSFKADGSSHTLVLNRISSAIWPALKERLNVWPKSCWKISDGACIDFSLDMACRLAQERGEKAHTGIKYRLRLVEEIAPQQLVSAPWRQSSVAEIARTIQARFDEDFDKSPPTDGREADNGRSLTT